MDEEREREREGFFRRKLEGTAEVKCA